MKSLEGPWLTPSNSRCAIVALTKDIPLKPLLLLSADMVPQNVKLRPVWPCSRKFYWPYLVWGHLDLSCPHYCTVVSPNCSLEGAPYFHTEAAVALCFWYFSCTVHSNGIVNDNNQLSAVQIGHCPMLFYFWMALTVTDIQRHGSVYGG